MGGVFRGDACLYKSHVAQVVVKAAERKGHNCGLDSLVEGQRVRQKAWELLKRLEAEGDHRGFVVALREVRECLKTFGEYLSPAGDRNLAGIPDAAILHKATRRGLKMPLNIRVLYDDNTKSRNPIVFGLPSSVRAEHRLLHPMFVLLQVQ
jgi:hypothetical protein